MTSLRWNFLMLVALGLLAVMRVVAGSALVALPSEEFQPRLNFSVYQPSISRDPFLKPGTVLSSAGLKTADVTLFHLDGFLGSTNNPTAIINGMVLNLNKPVLLETERGSIQVKAVKITLKGVTLEVAGKLVEVQREQ